MLSLKGAHVVILGGSSGMGLATARMVCESSGHVTIVGRDPQRLAQAQEWLGHDVRAFAADVADRDALAVAFADLAHVDHVAIFAGEQPAASVAATQRDTVIRALDVRVWAAYSAWLTFRKTGMAKPGPIAPSRISLSASVWPFKSSITTKIDPSGI